MNKTQVMKKFGFTDADDFDALLLDLAIDPEAAELTEAEVLTVKSHATSLTALPAPQEAKSGNVHGHLAVTDDEILSVAESTGIDLDIVMSAAMHVENLEALVRWVEEYKRLESEQEILDSARQQFELDQLRKKESELGDRLNAALNKAPVNTNLIRERLGVTVPKSITKLGNWDGKPGTVGEPDFLKSARAKVAKAGIGQN